MTEREYQDTIREIRSNLRLAMDGVVSSSMREKGVVYTLNFGVTLPRIKDIASRYSPDAALAGILWKEDVRELKILATLLYPSGSITPEKAGEWVRDIRHLEIAEQFCANLMQNVSFAETLADAWIQETAEFVRVSGFILYTRLCMKGSSLSREHAGRLIRTAVPLLQTEYSRTNQAAMTALKHYGRQSDRQAREVLSALEALSSSPEGKEIYHDFQFEFEYYK